MRPLNDACQAHLFLPPMYLQAGQVWFPDSALKTAQAIEEFGLEVRCLYLSSGVLQACPVGLAGPVPASVTQP